MLLRQSFPVQEQAHGNASCKPKRICDMRFDCINNLEGTNITSIFFSQTKLLTHGVKQLRHFFRLVMPVPVVSYSRAGQCETAPFVFLNNSLLVILSVTVYFLKYLLTVNVTYSIPTLTTKGASNLPRTHGSLRCTKPKARRLFKDSFARRPTAVSLWPAGNPSAEGLWRFRPQPAG